jgi:hypothetical protein
MTTLRIAAQQNHHAGAGVPDFGLWMTVLRVSRTVANNLRPFDGRSSQDCVLFRMGFVFPALIRV